MIETFSPISKAETDIHTYLARARAMRKRFCVLSLMYLNPLIENALKDAILTKFSALQSDKLTARFLSFSLKSDFR